MSHQCTSIRDDKRQFCDEMFPPPPHLSDAKPKPNLDGNPFELLKDANHMSEDEIARFFTEAINTFGIMPGFKFARCGNRPESDYVDEFLEQKIDAAFYHEELTPDDERPHWSDQVLPTEFKKHSLGQDVFHDWGETVPAEAESLKNSRNQIISYAELIFAVQQRVALFMLLVMGRRLRFIRWDRSGTYVTTALDYYVEWEYFCDILWRISNRTDEQLGLDPSATRICPGNPDYQRMTDAAAPNVNDINQEQNNDGGALDGREFMYVRDGFRKSLRPEWHRFKLEVPDGDGVREFLVGRPVFLAKGMAGRGTRGYIALDCKTGRFVWLKDSWRAHYLLVEKEGDILAELNAANVPNVPTLVCHGDIRDQETLTPLLWERKKPPAPATANDHPSSSSSSRTAVPLSSNTSTKRKRVDDDAAFPPQFCDPKAPDIDLGQPFREDCPLRLHKHYRMVVEEVGMPLSKFRDGRELVSVVYDCILAHEAAATNPATQRLHRDISAGNILIYPKFVHVDEYGITFLKWTGILSDWEMSQKPDDEDSKRKPLQPERTGTWPFMAVSVLGRTVKIVDIPEELESFFHVILYHTVRYLPSNCDDITIAYYLDSYFDTYNFCNGLWSCGSQKSDTIKYGELRVNEGVELHFDSPMDDLFAELLSWFSSHYAIERYERSQPETRAPSLPSSQYTPKNRPPSLAYPFPKRQRGQERFKRVINPAPTESQTIWASYLRSHSHILGCFEDAIVDARWPTVAGKRDRVPLGSKPNRDNPQPSMPTSSRSKRPRINGHAATIVFPLPCAPPIRQSGRVQWASTRTLHR
ncbi:hypothetical protein C8Q80DRAFT_1240978 [Daedaleopsis nitida]|nr:hypothetical protein C8Q80DRAFT_1240978 [Daedaleopsis nitida]